MARRMAMLGGSLALAGAMLAPAQLNAQRTPPDSSVTMVGTTLISVHYGAPSMAGRQVFGGIVPYGQPWRTGESDPTTFRTLRPLKMGDVTVPKGLYTVFTIPAEAKQDCKSGSSPGGTLILSRQQGGEYDQSQEAARVPMRVCRLEAPVERLTIRVQPGTGATGTFRIDWERTRFEVPFSLSR